MSWPDWGKAWPDWPPGSASDSATTTTTTTTTLGRGYMFAHALVKDCAPNFSFL